jgi:hypothetical protein
VGASQNQHVSRINNTRIYCILRGAGYQQHQQSGAIIASGRCARLLECTEELNNTMTAGRKNIWEMLAASRKQE